MTPEERLDRIERDLAGVVQTQSRHSDTLTGLMRTLVAFIDSSSVKIAALEHGLADLRQLVGETLTNLNRSVDAFLDGSSTRLTRIETNLAQLAEESAQSSRAADARMERVEANLDALIRAITADRHNGKN